MRSLAILTLRNEATFLIEWLSHHRAVGFTDFLVFSNDCQDGTDAMLERLQEMGAVTHVPNPGPYDKGGIQFTALKEAAKHPLVKAADWILALDIDEFVNIRTGDGSLDALRSALPEATAITLTWRLFGNAGQVRFSDVPVTDTFTKAAPDVLYWPWRASMFKTFYRNDGAYRKPGVHRPRDADDSLLPNARWFDCQGRELDEQFRTRRIFNNFGQQNYELAQLNHYPLGAMESYVLKADRGRAVHSEDKLGVDYWVERNFNVDEDTSISRYRAERNAHMETFLSDPVLSELHKDAVDWRKQRFDALMLQEPYRALFGRLLMTPPTRPVSQKAAKFLVSYGIRARNAPEIP